MDTTAGGEATASGGESGPRGGAGRLIAAGLGLYLLAILVARLLVAGGSAWVLLVFLAILLLLILAARVGFKAALVAVVLFCGAAAAFRWFMLGRYGWPALLLLPVVLVTGAIAGRVLAALRSDRGRRGGSVKEAKPAGQVGDAESEPVGRNG